MMRQVGIRINEHDYKALENRARQNNHTVSEEIRSLLKKSLTADSIDELTKVRTACTVESILLLRKFAQKHDQQLADEANQEARQFVKKLYAKVT